MEMHQSVSAKTSTLSISSTTDFLPLIKCPQCNLEVLRLVSKTTANPNKVFYKCPNYRKSKSSTCRFYMREDVYREYLEDAGIVLRTTEQEAHEEQEAICFPRTDSGNDYLMEQLKKMIKNEHPKIVQLLEEIKLILHKICIMMLGIVITLVVMMLMKLFK